jgi:hypothetical protein
MHRLPPHLLVEAKRRIITLQELDPTETDWKGWYMDPKKERYVHFAPPHVIPQILKDGRLRSDKVQMGAVGGVYAVSLTYGEFVPGVQTTHLARQYQWKRGTAPPDEARQILRNLKAIVFSSPTVPDRGHVEEVIWHRDVYLKSPRVVDYKTARNLLRRTPEKIDESDYVLYKRP